MLLLEIALAIPFVFRVMPIKLVSTQLSPSPSPSLSLPPLSLSFFIPFVLPLLPPSIFPFLSPQIYRRRAKEIGFEEYHAFLRVVSFDFAQTKPEAEAQPVLITVIQEDDSRIDR